jgi:hypothetical protein
MRLRPWQIFTCSICFASTLQSQEVRRALPVTPTPVPAPRAQPVFPDQVGQPSILDENIPSSQSAQPRRPVDNTKDVKTSTGSPAEPARKPEQSGPGRNPVSTRPGRMHRTPTRPKLNGDCRRTLHPSLYDLAVPGYEKYLSQFFSDSGALPPCILAGFFCESWPGRARP